MEQPSYEAMRQAARDGKLEVVETGPHPHVDANGRGIYCMTYHAHFTDGRGSWEVLLDRRLELARDGATVRNPEAEEIEEHANKMAEP